ncbi:MAG TPA: LpxD N-terminal domain-containing protein, partial [Xanthomonadales bacterium]|nr:LpxD N-terminal domain-containing protein [Xanthomonadales bacterium]
MSGTTVRLGELASRFGLELRGDASKSIDGVATLARANGTQLAFLANPQYRVQLANTQAGAVVLASADAAGAPGAVLVAPNPYAAFARIAALFETRAAAAPGVHATAVVDATATIDPGATVGPFCFVGARSRVEAGAELGPHCVVGADCVVGAQSRL